jgi:hypothetical protein
VLDVEDVVYVDDVAEDDGKSTGPGGLDDSSAVFITAHTSNANKTTAATPPAITSCC